MDYDGTHNAMTNQANKQPGLLRRLGTTGAIIVAACLAAGATFLGYGVDANLPWPVTANTTIAPKYCGGTVQAGTGSTGQFTLTLPAVTGFPTNCSVLIKNGDSTNGKILTGFPVGSNTILWPKQSIGVKIVNGGWQSFYNPGPWLVPTGGLTLYASPSGNDANDGLTSATPVTFAGACNLRNQFATFLSSAGMSIQLADGTYSTAVNGALCTINGNSGGSSSQLTSIQGDSGTPTNVVLAVPSGAGGILIQDGGEAGVNNLEISAVNGSGPGIQCRQLAVCDYNNIYWGTWGNSGAHVSVTGGASSNSGNETILANFYVHWNLSAGAQFAAGGTTSIPSAVTWTLFAEATNSNVDITSWAYSGSGASGSTGATFIGAGAGYLSTPGNAACNGGTWPGNGNCQFQQLYQDSHGDGLTTPLQTPWGVASGGTGNATAAAHSIPISEGTSAQNSATTGAAGQLLIDQGSGNDPAFAPMSGDATIAASGALTVGSNKVTNAKLAAMAANTIKCNNTGSAATPTDCTASQTAGITEQGMTLLNVVTVSAAANISDTSSFTSAYNDYLIMLDNIVPATNGVNFNCQVQSGGSFQTSGYVSQGGATSYFDLLAGSSALSNAVGYGYSGQLWLHGANSANYKALIARNDLWWSAAGTIGGNSNAIGAWTGGTGAITGIQCQASTGNISGTISIYGLRKAL
jgi:hypothetical protein